LRVMMKRYGYVKCVGMCIMVKKHQGNVLFVDILKSTFHVKLKQSNSK